MGGKVMSRIHGVARRVAQLGLLLLMGVSISADAGFLGFGGDSWKEEVLLHDSSKIIAKRSLSYGGRREIGQSAPIKEQAISFTLPNSNQAITWKSEYSEDIGRANFNLLALHILNGTPYIVTVPNLCLSYNKWGRPNPPYVFFKHDGKEWQRIPLSEFPAEFKTLNIAIYLGYQDVDLMVEEGLVPAETIKRRNGELTQHRYKTILREPYPGAEGSCSEMIYGGKDSGWHGVDLFGDTYDACLQYCRRKKISDQSCPCETLFKGKK